MDDEMEIEKRSAGRPSKLTADVEMRILNGVRCGAPNRIACTAAGVSEQTFYNWLRLAEEQPDSEYARFAESLARAREEGITARLAIVMKAGRSDWRAAAWLLERDLPDAFSMKCRLEHAAAPMSIADFMVSLARKREEIDGQNTPAQIEAPREPEEE